MNSIQAAIYVRKSPDEKNREVSADVKSVSLQIENAKAFATKQGWTVADEHVYQDDQVSGGSFDPDQRPAFFRLLAAASKTPPPFEAVIVRDQDRWGRDDSGRSVLHLSELAENGTTVYEYVSGQPILVATGEQRLIAHIKSYLAAGERAKAKARVKEAHAKRAKAGWLTGSVPYGYDKRDVLGADGKRSHVVRVINETQAAVVRRIFALYDQGLGHFKIAERLNRESVPGTRGGKWSSTVVREILNNPLYGGTAIWGREKLVDRKGKVGVRVKREEAEQIRVAVPELRIIEPELYERVQQRLQRQKHAFTRTTKGEITGRIAKVDFESKYLLGGLARCAVCGGGLAADLKSSGNGKSSNLYYRCETARKQGPTACTNRTAVPAELIEPAVVAAVAERLAPEVVLAEIEKVLAAHRANRPDTAVQQAQVAEALKKCQATVARLVNDLAGDDLSDDARALVKAKLNTEAAREKALRAEAEALVQAAAPPVAPEKVKIQVEGRTAALLGLLGAVVESPARARSVLRQLGVRLDVHPVEGSRGAKSVPVIVRGSYQGLLKGAPILGTNKLGPVDVSRVFGEPGERGKLWLLDGGQPPITGASDATLAEGATVPRPPPIPPPGTVARAEPALGAPRNPRRDLPPPAREGARALRAGSSSHPAVYSVDGARGRRMVAGPDRPVGDRRKVRAPQGRVLDNVQGGRPHGQRHRKQTAAALPSRGKGETVR